MDIKESANMNPEDEFNHWWIQTRFLYLRDAYKNNGDILEVGCGTGVNLKFLEQFVKDKKIYGVDENLLSESPTLKKDIHTIPEINFLVLMDVLEHVQEDEKTLKEWLQKLTPDGLVFITVPAYQFLWSKHDEFLEHKRRYTKKSLETLAQNCGLMPLKVHYAFSYLIPLVLLIRKLGLEKQAGLKKHSRFMNFIMKFLGKIEYFLGGAPFGTSVVGVFRKC